VGSLVEILKKGFHFSGQSWMNNEIFLDLLMNMLTMQAFERISPEEVMGHPFMRYS